MAYLLPRIRSLLRGPAIPSDLRPTYVRHFGYVILSAIALGILANAPLMAVKRLAPEDWHLTLRMVLAGAGQLLILYLGNRMATRRKMNFVMVPGVGFAVCSLAMALVMDSALVFLALLGIGTLFETITRPAITAIIRLKYPVTHRGSVTGELRRWSSLIFLIANLASAWALDRAAGYGTSMPRAQLLLAAALSLASFLVFRRIRVHEEHVPVRQSLRPAVLESFKESYHILAGDRRFQQYLLGGFLYCFGALLYVSFYEPFLCEELKYSYTGAAVLIHVLPSLLAFITTGAWGRSFDRTSVWKAWSWIRTGWGLDALIMSATPMAAAAFAPAAGILPFVARTCRGTVMGGSWVLWWQIGVTHFAPPGADTTRYMGILMFMNGLTRIVAPLTGAWLISQYSRAAVFLIGGGLVILSAAHSLWWALRERGEKRLATVADFEASYERTVE